MLAGPLGLLGMGTTRAHPHVDVDPCKNPPSSHHSAQLPPPPGFLPTDSMPPGSLGWQPKMVEVGISLAPQAGVLDSSLLLSLEKVVSHAPGLLSHAFPLVSCSSAFPSVPTPPHTPLPILPSFLPLPNEHPVPLSSVCGKLVSD